MPLFSIIVPVYNVQNYLADCIKSVAEQEGPRDWECLLIDDGSTDLCPQLCDTFAREIPGVQVIHRKNGGLAAARNTGLGAAKGDWVLFLDSDDAMAPGLLATLRRELAAHPGYDWYVGKHLEWQPDGTLTEHEGLHLLPGPFDSTDYGPFTGPDTGRCGNTACAVPGWWRKTCTSGPTCAGPRIGPLICCC